MASDDRALEELRSELTCSVCLELFCEPVILDCGHHFCRLCITECWGAKSEESPTCPQCRKACTATLRPNSLLCNVVDSVRRVKVTDTRLWDPSTGQMEITQKQWQESPDSRGRDLCAEHEEKLKLFCEDDQVAICLVCGMSRDHKTHSVIPINEAFENYKEKLSAALHKVHFQMEEAAQSQTKTNENVMVTKERIGALENQITCEFRQLRDFLDREEDEVKCRLSREKEQSLSTLGDTLRRTSAQIGRLERTAEELQLKLREENPALLMGIKDFICSTEAVFDPPQETSTDLQEGQFVGPLQYRLWRKMSSILDPAPTAMTLDPDTAYPRLTVSPCRTSVSVGEIQPNLPNNPERFTRYNIVLGSEGFASGRHYWEVEVGEKIAWGLGVAAESVNRKEEISLCPEDGFWTLVLRNGNEYEACTSAENLLSLPRRPQRIGVYLDYARGQVAFYDAGDMSHLYTFSDTFTEKVYPYFNPWPIINSRNREPLTIIALSL